MQFTSTTVRATLCSNGTTASFSFSYKRKTDKGLSVLMRTSKGQKNHFFLHSSNYSIKKNIFEKISIIKHSLLNHNDATIVETFLFGLNDLNDKESAMIIESTTEYIRTMERFIAPLL